MKRKVIFIHPLKTGGTSVRYMLLKEYGYGRIAPVPMGAANQAEPYPTNSDLPLVVQERISPEQVADFDVVMSHYDWRITERLPDWEVITILRDPVEQLRSLYQFMAARPQYYAEAGWMAGIGFRGWLESEHVRPYLNNQTAYLSGHHRRDVNVALQNLEHDKLYFGLLERFEETVAQWNEHFGWSMVVEHRNEAENPLVLDDETRALAQALQLDDMVLYAEAEYLFGRSRPDLYDPIVWLNK